jgi:hypothetical protein
LIVGNEKMMKTMPENHPLVGTWITENEDSNVAVVIKSDGGPPQVECFTRSDGGFHDITDLLWDGESLEFHSTVPSNGWKTKHVFRAAPDGTAHVEFTWYEVWKQSDAKPGQLPEAWREDPNE